MVLYCLGNSDWKFTFEYRCIPSAQISVICRTCSYGGPAMFFWTYHSIYTTALGILFFSLD